MEREKVYDVTEKMIAQLEAYRKDGRETALFASLRNTTGRTFAFAAEVWPFMFSNMPEMFLGTGTKTTYEENAIFQTLQYYAICMQGTADAIYTAGKEAGSMGKSLNAIRTGDYTALDRRFNAMITSTTYVEFTYHLRQLIKILKSKAKTGVNVNFAKLAEDLYWYQRDKKNTVCFEWAKEYYSSTNAETKEEQENE